VVGIWQVQNHPAYFKTASQAGKRLLSTFLKPIMIPAMFY
jgi:hypothetical protein